MCGIVAYTGAKAAAPILFDGLKKLEYRGYDSAGIAVLNGQYLSCIKRAGRVDGISDARALTGSCGVGHTRWATHGGAKDKNAHPHTCGKFTVVHNGIIENYAPLKGLLSGMGHVFSSETDSEAAAHLLSEYYEGDLFEAVKRTVNCLRGSFALCILCSDYPDTVVCARKKSPLIVGRDESGTYAASDLPALGGCQKIRVLSDGEIAFLRADGIRFFNFDMRPLKAQLADNTLSYAEQTEKGGYPHFMLKEIFEVPSAIRNTFHGFALREAARLKERVSDFSLVYLVACGTAYHSALTGAALLEKALRVPVLTEFAGEFCYRRPLLNKNCLVIAVSQSGETADTLAAGRLAKKKGATLAVITNVGYSSLCRLADYKFVTCAGTEVGVAATKTYAAQLTVFYILSAFLSGKTAAGLKRIPKLCNELLTDTMPEIIARKAKDKNSVFFLGRGADYPSATEGSLKLREVAYVAGAGYAAGELKHGSIALIDENSLVVAVITRKDLKEKSKNAVSEVRSRGATVVAVTPFSDVEADEIIALPPCPQKYYPLLSEIPLQLLAYHSAILRGHDPDRPRNLAKSVTVE